jgi:hypothetical protein
MPMARLRLLGRMPIWVRVTATIGLVLIAVLVGTVVLGGSGESARDGSGGHGSGVRMQQRTDHNAGDHSSRAGTETMDH